MPLRLEDKKAVVNNLAKVAENATSVVLADYRGLTVNQLTEFRAKARQSGVVARIVRNTLIKRAFKDTAFVCLQDVLTGPIILLLSYDDPGSGARLVRDFMKVNKALEVKALSLGGELFAASALEKVAMLPMRDEALAMLLSVMKAPITKFVRTLAEPYAQVTRLMAAVRDQKQAVSQIN